MQVTTRSTKKKTLIKFKLCVTEKAEGSREVKNDTHCRPVLEPQSLIYGPEFFHDSEEQHKTAGRKVLVTDQRRVPGDRACRKCQRGRDFSDTAVAAKKIRNHRSARNMRRRFFYEKRSDRTQNLNMSKNWKEKEACTNRVTSKPSKLKKGHTIQFLFIFSGAKILKTFLHMSPKCVGSHMRQESNLVRPHGSKWFNPLRQSTPLVR